MPELAMARETHVATTRALVADTLDLIHRLPATWSRVVAGECEPWVARKVAVASRALPADRVGVVDRAVAKAIRGHAPSTVLQIAAAKVIVADPQAHAERREYAARERYVRLSRCDEFGYRHVIAKVTAGDAAWIDAMIDRVADILTLTHGADHNRDELRSLAFGWLARHRPGLRDRRRAGRARHGGPVPGPRPDGSDRPRRHPPGPGPRPGDAPPGRCYEHDETLKDKVWLLAGGDVFPFNPRTAARDRVDFDHSTPYDPTGPPGQTGAHKLRTITPPTPPLEDPRRLPLPPPAAAATSGRHPTASASSSTTPAPEDSPTPKPTSCSTPHPTSTSTSHPCASSSSADRLGTPRLERERSADTLTPVLDTVAVATEDATREQPWAELGLKPDEYARIREILGRRPTASELAMYSVMWSEHCSYKSSKVHLKQFGEIPQETPVGKMLAGIGENAGVIDVGQGYAVTFKIESHNHPSYVEPYQGAATGVGGIVRDILAMGARPVAVMDPLRFGPLDADDTHRVLPGIVAGVGGYGNCLGLPNIGGEAVFDETYLGNPLVNALCVGVLRHEDLHLARASGAGNKVILYGAKTGGDGIGGVSVLASETFQSSAEGGPAGPSRRPSVQVGDPFMEKLLIECTLELFAAGVVAGIQDLGGAGLSCATSELASAGDGGMHVDLDLVPLRDSSLAPEEILMSESQERMMAVVEPGDVDRFLAICEKWDVDATVVGEVTTVSDSDRSRGGRLQIFWHGELIVDVPPRSVAHDGPTYERPLARPDWQDGLQADDAAALPRPESGAELRETLLRLLGSANLCDKSWITDQYDRYVRGNTVLAQPADSGMIRIDEDTNLGIAVSTDCNARFAKLDPYAGARLALAEAYRNVAAGGAMPLAVSDCLNFGSPEDPAVMWQFAEACRGLKDACVELGIPVTGGNVSLYNQTGETAILPTPVVAVLGVIDDVTRRTPTGFVASGERIYHLGQTRDETSGSEWAHVVHGHLGGRPPVVDLSDERKLATLLVGAARSGLLTSAHDLSDGGLAQALAESVLASSGSGSGHGIGCTVRLEGSPFVGLFAESATRAIVTVPDRHVEAFEAMAGSLGVPCGVIGTTGGDALVVEGRFSIGIDELRETWTRALPAAFG